MYLLKNLNMKLFLLIILRLVGIKCWSDNTQRRFKDNFLFGVASSSYQVEGGWNSDGKGESIWDTFVHDNPEIIQDGSNGDVSSKSYELYKRDVEMLRELRVDFYRFSISWPRILPNGLPQDKNDKGIEYYENLIDEMLKYNIEPMVTLYHFDLPQKLQDQGGWTNSKIVDWFEDYSRLVFDKFGGRVRKWITFNQPNTICQQGYGDGVMAPGISGRGTKEYECIKNVLLAHARAWHLYDREYRSKYNGSVGISLAVNWADPINNATDNVKAAEDYREFSIGLYANPIFSKEGDFPRIVKSVIKKKSTEQGYKESRLPTLTYEEIRYIKGSADFLGVNHYTTVLIKKAERNFEVPSFDDDVNVEYSFGQKWRRAKSEWLRSAPYGLYKASLWLNKMYDYPEVYITEHGWSTDVGYTDDDRVDNLRGYFDALLLAIEDGTKVNGYTAWSLMDNFEWLAGYSERFGLYEVDFESENKTRTARKSALVYRHIIESRIVDHTWQPKSLDITISKKRLKSQDEL